MMEMWLPKSERVDSFSHGEIRLSLATWQPEPFFPATPEIGWRKGEEFHLIQWRGVSQSKAWDIAKRMVIKGKSANSIQKVLDRIGY